MNHWMNFGGGFEQNAWAFGWDALAALGTLLAVGAALFVHFHQQSVARKEDKQRRQARTTAVAPQLVADAMRLNWEIAQALRTVKKASNLQLAARTAELVGAWQRGAFALTVQPGAEIYGGDLELLLDSVREKLAQLKAQVTVCNAMWHRLLAHPSSAPFASREEAVGELMKDAVHQLVDTNTSSIALLEALDPYLPQQLKEMQISLRREESQFLRIYEEVPKVERQRNR